MDTCERAADSAAPAAERSIALGTPLLTASPCARAAESAARAWKTASRSGPVAISARVSPVLTVSPSATRTFATVPGAGGYTPAECAATSDPEALTVTLSGATAAWATPTTGELFEAE